MFGSQSINRISSSRLSGVGCAGGFCPVFVCPVFFCPVLFGEGFFGVGVFLKKVFSLQGGKNEEERTGARVWTALLVCRGEGEGISPPPACLTNSIYAQACIVSLAQEKATPLRRRPKSWAPILSFPFAGEKGVRDYLRRSIKSTFLPPLAPPATCCFIRLGFEWDDFDLSHHPLLQPPLSKELTKNAFFSSSSARFREN